ncbi:MAG: hypothetical protein ETSY2_40565 [Candidatus Entotheonella gemina]|uniref:PKD domain-containing protein n=1 Tax=Candidatus Entotheonella gemina TaxID=1429439 RepID=W4LNE3_9BACT|nr:MAG: hypothetical protein ETSY2_40565 [Candidatus Entotheonella gemina]
MQDSPALTKLYEARDAITKAGEAGAKERFPDDFADLESQYLKARGTYYACQEDQALTMGEDLVTLAKAIETRRVAPVTLPNRPPTAFLAGPGDDEIEVEQAARFSARHSADPDGDALTYQWDWGDGTTSDVMEPMHQYEAPGVYTVVLTVTDGKGGSDTATTPVTVIRRVVIRSTGSQVLFDFDQATLPSAAQEQDGPEILGFPSMRALEEPHKRGDKSLIMNALSLT